MEPLSALSVASSAIQVFDFGTKLWSKVKDVYESENGMLAAHENLRAEAKRLCNLNWQLRELLDKQSLQRVLTSTEESVVGLCRDCDTAADELVAALDRVTIKDDSQSELSDRDLEDEDDLECRGGKRRRKMNRKWQSVCTAMRGIWTRRDVDKLRLRFETLKSSLVSAILVNIQSEITKLGRRSSLISESRDVNWGTAKAIVDWIGSHQLDTPQSRTNLLNIITSDRNETQDEDHLSFSKRQYKNARLHSWPSSSKRLIEPIISKLWFPEMFDRQDRIPETFQHTFQWIFEEPRNPAKPWDSFASWLTMGENIYWITGKAGSGKSTLMKMLFESPRTKHLLRRWSGDTPIVTVAFYFWNPGSELQMSQNGLLLSVLQQALVQRLKFPSVLLRRKLEAFALSGGSIESSPLAWKDLLQLFRFLVDEEDQEAKYFFAFDGLDEFSGDHSKLVSLVHTLGAYPNVKICVSSRPYNVFEDGFRRQPSLMLQHLTFDDIELYVRETLASQPAFCELAWGSPEEAKRLVLRVTTKASGVFLWVVLAVNSLVRGLMDGDRVRDLEDRLDEIPDELEELFKKMLYGLKGRYFSDAARLFRIYRASQRDGIGFDRGLPLLALDFADEADFKSTTLETVKPLTGKEWYMRSTSMKRRLNGRCQGLIEIEHPKRPDGVIWKIREIDQLVSEAEAGEATALLALHSYGRDLGRTNVQYLHRTVKDYLEGEGVWKIIEDAAADNDVDPVTSLLLANIRLWKSFEEGYRAIITTSSQAIETFRTMLERCLECAKVLLKKDKATYFKLLGIIEDALFGKDTSTSVPRQKLGISSPINDFMTFAVHSNLFEYVNDMLSQPPPRNESRVHQCSSLLKLAVSKDSSIISISDTPDLQTGDNIRTHDDRAGFRGYDKPNIHMVRILLGHGADPLYRINGTCSSTIVEHRLREGEFFPELSQILSVFDKTPKKTGSSSISLIGRGKRLFKEEGEKSAKRKMV